MHEHNFQDHIGIPVFDHTAIAWVPAIHVENRAAWKNVDTAPHMQRCVDCGEQGYEVR